LIIVLTIIFIYYLSHHDDMETKDIVGTFIYMMLAVVGLIYIHDHAMNKDVSQEVKKVMPVIGAAQFPRVMEDPNTIELNKIRAALGNSTPTSTSVYAPTSVPTSVVKQAGADSDGDESDDDTEEANGGEVNNEYFT